MHVFLLIPVMNEAENLPVLFDCIQNQSDSNFTVIFCVNQPEKFWYATDKINVCLNNERSLNAIQHFAKRVDFPVHVIDKTSKGKGWRLKDQGVGQARRDLMDSAVLTAHENDILLSTDADTFLPVHHIAAVRKLFMDLPYSGALSIPYFHQAQGNEAEQKSILRYEMYMRYYVLNLIRIGSPYAYTAIGSAMACTVKAYKRIGGLAPKASGEDFYFMMQLRKTGALIPWCDTMVHPSSRSSDRVIFGTGTAVSHGIKGDWSRYIFYDMEAYDRIADANRVFSAFFDGDETAKDLVLSVFPEIELEKLRKNHPKKERFVHACHEKADSLSILQTLKRLHSGNFNDSENLMRFCMKYYSNMPVSNFSFEHSSVKDYLRVREFLFHLETVALKEKYNEYMAQRNNKSHSIWKYMI